MQVLATRDGWWTTQCEAALASQGIPVRWQRSEDMSSAVLLDVATSEMERAAEILSEQLGEELRRRRERPTAAALAPLFLQPAFATALCLSLLLVAFFWVSGGFGGGSAIFEHGAMITRRFQAGEWWRIVTGATLHADWEHVLGNAGFLLVLGWACGERVGVGLTFAFWLVTAVGGFVASLVYGKATMTVGASGGLFGLLGVAAGHGLRNLGKVEFQRREYLRVFGAALALLAFTAFSPQANIAAHLGGFVTGLALGSVCPRHPISAGWQAIVGIGAGLVVVLAWVS